MIPAGSLLGWADVYVGDFYTKGCVVGCYCGSECERAKLDVFHLMTRSILVMLVLWRGVEVVALVGPGVEVVVLVRAEVEVVVIIRAGVEAVVLAKTNDTQRWLDDWLTVPPPTRSEPQAPGEDHPPACPTGSSTLFHHHHIQTSIRFPWSEAMVITIVWWTSMVVMESLKPSPSPPSPWSRLTAPGSDGW